MIDFSITDTHVHLLDQKALKYSWAAGAPKLNRDFSVADLDKAAAPYKIDTMVFVEVDVDQPLFIDEAHWVQGVADRDPRLKGAVFSLPMEQGAKLEPQMEKLASLKVARGIRRLIQNQPDPEFCIKPDFVAAVKLLAKYNLSFDICIFHHQLGAAIELVKRCPNVSFILDHIAKPGIKAGLMEPWARQMREMAALPNVLCKISGVITEADHGNWTREQVRPYIAHAIEAFGFNRVMYGGDWPVVDLAGDYTRWLELADWATADASADERRKLFRDNGIAAYRLG